MSRRTTEDDIRLLKLDSILQAAVDFALDYHSGSPARRIVARTGAGAYLIAMGENILADKEQGS